MGYKISVPVKKKIKKKLFSFLEENLKDDNEIDVDFNDDFVTFYYGPGYYGRDYTYAICKWTAIEAGKLKSFNGSYKPYYIYEDTDEFEVNSIWNEDDIANILKHFPEFKNDYKRVKNKFNILKQEWNKI